MLKGVDSSGRFRTAKAKEYPPSMNKAIALSFELALDDQDSNASARSCDEEDYTDLMKYWLKMDPYQEDLAEAEMQPDYAKGPKQKASARSRKRCRAERRAKELLEELKEEQKCGNEAALEILHLWEFGRNTFRTNVIPEGKT